MKILSFRLLVIVIISFCFHTVPVHANDFNSWMRVFEQAKAKSDFPSCEEALLQALKYGDSEYAVGSLVWSEVRQNKTEIALKHALLMVEMYGYTPYAVGSVLDASFLDGDFETLAKAVQIAKARDLGNGTDWRNGMVRALIKRAESLIKPTVYELSWTIPGKEFTQEHPARLVCLPLLKTARQTFTYKVDGAASYRVIQASPKGTTLEITGKPGQNVYLSGTATLQSQVLGGRALRHLSQIPLQPAPERETGVFYFGTEPYDPKLPAIAPVVQEVARRSAVETVQAILDWRDKNMPYGALREGPGTTLERVMIQRRGVCHDACYMTASLARANGIPAIVMGVVPLPEEDSFADAGNRAHGCICVKLPQVGWVYVEPLDRTSLQTFDRSNYLEFHLQEERSVGGTGLNLPYLNLQGMTFSGKRVQ